MKIVRIFCLMFLFLASETKAEFIISKDATSPISDIVLGGRMADLGVFRLTVDATEDIDIDSIRFNTTNGNMLDALFLHSVYGENDLLGSVIPGSDTADFTLFGGDLIVLRNWYSKIAVKASLPLVNGTTITNGTIIKTGLYPSNAVVATSLSSALTITSGGQSAIGNTMVLYQSRPYFSLAPESPSGDMYPGTFQQLAIFNVSAAPNGDVTFKKANGNSLTVNINAVKISSDGTPNNFYLKDEEGNLLSIASAVDGATSVTFDFSASDFIVPAGENKKLYVYGDVSDFAYDGDVIQLYLNDSNPNNIKWGINGVGNYYEADKIFRGDIYGGTFIVPEPATIGLLALGSFFLRRKRV